MIKNIFSKFILCVMFASNTPLAKPVTISQNTALSGAAIGGVLSSAAGYGFFVLLEKVYNKVHRGEALTHSDRALLRTLASEELAEEDLDFTSGDAKKNSWKRTLLLSLVVIASGIIGGTLTYNFLDGYTNEGRIEKARDILDRINKDAVLEGLVAHHQDWTNNDDALDRVLIKFGPKNTYTQLKKHLDRSLEELATSSKNIQKVHESRKDLARDAVINDLDDRIKTRLTALRHVSTTLDSHISLIREKLDRAREADERRRMLDQARGLGSFSYRLMQTARS